MTNLGTPSAFSEGARPPTTMGGEANWLHSAHLMRFKKQTKEALEYLQGMKRYFEQHQYKLNVMACRVELTWLPWLETAHNQGKSLGQKPSLTAEAQSLWHDLEQWPHPVQVAVLKVRFLHYQGLFTYKQGDFGKALLLFKEAQKHCPPQTLEYAQLLDSLAIYYEAIGNFDHASRLLTEAVAMKRQAGPLFEQAITLQILGRLYLVQEYLTDAQQVLEEAYELSCLLGDSKRQLGLLNDQIRLALLQENYPRVSQLIAQLEQNPALNKLSVQYATLLFYKASLLFAQGQSQPAQTMLCQQVLPLYAQHPHKKGLGMAKRLEAVLLGQQGKLNEALEAMSEAIALFRQQRRLDEMAKTYLALGKLYAQMGHSQLASQSLWRALKIAEQHSLTFLVQPIEEALLVVAPQEWQALVERRVKHLPLFDEEQTPNYWPNSNNPQPQTTDSAKTEAPLGQPLPGPDYLGERRSSLVTLGRRNADSQGQSLMALLRVGQAMAAERDLAALLNMMREETQRALKAERCTVFVYDRQSNELWSQVATGMDRQHEIRIPSHKGLAGYVLKTGEVLNITDAYNDPRFNPEVDRQTGYHTRNILCMSVRNQMGEPIAVFQVLNKQDGPFNQADEELLTALTASAGIAMENSLLAQSQRKAFDSFILTLSSTIDARDPITAGHSERVADFAGLIGDEMGMSNPDKEALRYASLLHDIGKIGIRESVLVKDGRLTVEEYKHIQKHAEFTYDILKNINFEKHLAQVPEIAASHHEKMDGSGYFRGTKGTDIPLSGRVLAISDVFDAITSRRHYRSRMPFDRVMKILRKDAGSHFDSDCMHLFFRLPLSYIAEVLVKERLFTQVSEAAALVPQLDKRITLAEFEALLKKPNKTHQEEALEQLFARIYYVMPLKEQDRF